MDGVNVDIAGENIYPCKLCCNVLLQKPDKSTTCTLRKNKLSSCEIVMIKTIQ